MRSAGAPGQDPNLRLIAAWADVGEAPVAASTSWQSDMPARRFQVAPHPGEPLVWLGVVDGRGRNLHLDFGAQKSALNNSPVQRLYQL